MKDSQNKQILQYMKEVGPITPLIALSLFGCMRLSARIKDLRDRGHIIRTRMIEVETAHGGKATVAEYSYVGERNLGKDN